MHVLLFSAFFSDFPKIKGFQIGNQAITWILGVISKSPGRQSLQNQIIFQMVYHNPSFIMSPCRVLLVKDSWLLKIPQLTWVAILIRDSDYFVWLSMIIPGEVNHNNQAGAFTGSFMVVLYNMKGVCQKPRGTFKSFGYIDLSPWDILHYLIHLIYEKQGSLLMHSNS